MTVPTSTAELNKQTFARVLAAFARKDIEALQAAFSPDVTFLVPGRNPMSGEYRGIAAVLGFLGQASERTSGTENVTLDDLLASDEHVVALCTVHGQRHGKTLLNRVAYVARIEQGRVSMVRMHNYDQHHVDAFWA